MLQSDICYLFKEKPSLYLLVMLNFVIMSKKIKKLIESLLGSISGNSSGSKRNPERKLIPIPVSSENKNRPF